MAAQLVSLLLLLPRPVYSKHSSRVSLLKLKSDLASALFKTLWWLPDLLTVSLEVPTVAYEVLVPVTSLVSSPCSLCCGLTGPFIILGTGRAHSPFAFVLLNAWNRHSSDNPHSLLPRLLQASAPISLYQKGLYCSPCKTAPPPHHRSLSGVSLSFILAPITTWYILCHF